MKVRDAMTASVVSVRPDTSLKDVAALLAEHRIGGVPVVDDEGRVRGVVCTADILVKELADVPFRGLSALLHHREASALSAKVSARTAGEAMTEPAVTIEPWRRLAAAAAEMVEHGVSRLPVVEHDRLVGIIARSDLVRAFARTDSELVREIRNEALRSIDRPESLQLTVENGEVTLRGEVDSRYDAEALPREVRTVVGVVSVDAELTGWDPDEERPVLLTSRL